VVRSDNTVGFRISKDMLRSVQKQNVHYVSEKIKDKEFLIYNKYVLKKNADTGQVWFEGILQIGTRVDDINRILQHISNFLVFFALFVILLAATLGSYLSRKALKPIEYVIDATNTIGNRADLDKRIEHHGPQDEIGRLTGTINGMLERIQATYNELEESHLVQRRFVSDASHELRTPLTTIRGNVELLDKIWSGKENDTVLSDEEKEEMSRDSLRDIADEAARMSRLVNDMLSLARADAGYEMNKELLALQPLVEEVARKAALLPKKAEWRIGNLEALEGAEVYGSRDYLQQLLYIFIENAFKYTERGHVMLDAFRSGDHAALRISDTGMGMDKAEVPHIFERFYRADLSRGVTSGTGLGLSIAKWIIDEHEGSIEVMTAKGEGTVFVIWLPLRFPPMVE
jgi:two-component system OmpR family sensor kinase